MAESSRNRSGDFDFVSKHSDLISDYDANSNSSLIVNHGGVFGIVSEDNPQLSRLLEFSLMVDGERRLDDVGTMVSSFEGDFNIEELVDVVTLWNPGIKEDDCWCHKIYGFGFDAKMKFVGLVVENCLNTNSWKVTELADVPLISKGYLSLL